ncbi:hypothetical protein AQJ23_17470 [Streptomyces antibioticus]|nr:hypothetical protein AQJ23_17470 [Streptomyces antibioticus]
MSPARRQREMGSSGVVHDLRIRIAENLFQQRLRDVGAYASSRWSTPIGTSRSPLSRTKWA